MENHSMFASEKLKNDKKVAIFHSSQSQNEKLMKSIIDALKCKKYEVKYFAPKESLNKSGFP